MARSPRLEIEYCRQCRWLLRARRLPQELLTTIAHEMGEDALVPGTGEHLRSPRRRRNRLVTQAAVALS